MRRKHIDIYDSSASIRGAGDPPPGYAQAGRAAFVFFTQEEDMPIILGTTGSDHIAGTDGNDAIAGGKGVDYLYGGAGSDCFTIRLSDMDASLTTNSAPGAKAQDFIYDFHGAGVYEPGNNDFLYLDGFGAGSTITFSGYGYNSTNPGGDIHAQYYTIHSTTTGLDYVIAIGSVNGNQLVLGDYNFYN
jgi:Ca2+-binding RTX toxin-like protein